MRNLTPEVGEVTENIVEKGIKCSLEAMSPLFHNMFYLLLDFFAKTKNRYLLWDKRLFKISEV